MSDVERNRGEAFAHWMSLSVEQLADGEAETDVARLQWQEEHLTAHQRGVVKMAAKTMEAAFGTAILLASREEEGEHGRYSQVFMETMALFLVTFALETLDDA